MCCFLTITSSHIQSLTKVDTICKDYNFLRFPIKGTRSKRTAFIVRLNGNKLAAVSFKEIPEKN